MASTRHHRQRLILAIIAAIPLEVAGIFLLKHAPHIGVPADPNYWLRLGGDIAALTHAPWLILANFLCVKFCPPNFVLQTLIIAGGYLDTVALLWAAAALFRLWQDVVSMP